jgi:hypothetical protein
MEFPSYREFSQANNEDRKHDGLSPRFWLLQIGADVLLFWVYCLLKAMVHNFREKQQFDKKYKTVIKENWLGMKSYEFHERETE